ncbi:MAG: Holliday junction branch migration protein RuvA [Negativibacillus sp.]|nr:Holliday junction branch migration protein RuvA [Negativibacillus sp.]
MIYSLRGKLIHVEENAAVIECAGVGYRCSVTRTTLNALPPVGAEAMLYTWMNVREGAVDLFGFATSAEKNCFGQLTSVSGVGPKVALAILSELKPDQLMLALVSQDVKSLTRAAGVGKKLAERILLELRDKVKTEELSEQMQQISQVGSQLSEGTGSVAEAVSALVVLGYSQSDAARAVAGQPPEASVQELVKLGLKKLAGSR